MRNLLIISHLLSFDIFSFSLQEKFLTVGCVSKCPQPIVFIVRSAGLVCFSDPDLLKKPGLSLNDAESRQRLKMTIPNLSYL